MLRQIERSGAVSRAANRRLTGGTQLPELTVVERVGADQDGVPLVSPVTWPGPDPAPLLRLAEEGGESSPGRGSRCRAAGAAATMARSRRGSSAGSIPAASAWSASIRRIARAAGWCRPTAATRASTGWPNATPPAPVDGELVVAEVLPKRRFGPPRARIIERLGRSTDPGAISLMAIASFDIPTEFPAAAIAEAEAAAPVGPAGRTDLRDLPLVTIDGSDARDFDDAVWAEPDPDPANPGGWHLVVAIADVAWYVRPGSALDHEAERRGNSVYFPDRVVPMLPEALSNDLCSLKPGVDRACLAVHLSIDAAGRKRGHRFVRALMRSAARLTYEEVQAIQDRQREPPGSVPRPGDRGALRRFRSTGAGARGARRAGARPARRSRRARRRSAAGRGRPGAAPRQPSADRGIHDPRQCRRGRRARGPSSALHVPRPRRAGPGEDRGPARFPRRERHPRPGIRQGPSAEARTVQPASASRRRHPGRPARQRAGLALSGAGGLQPKQYRPFRAGVAALRPFHLADPALCRSSGSSRTDRGRQRGRRRLWRWRAAAGGRSRADGCDRRAHLGDRAARRSGRARRHRSLSHEPCSPRPSAAPFPGKSAASPISGCS